MPDHLEHWKQPEVWQLAWGHRAYQVRILKFCSQRLYKLHCIFLLTPQPLLLCRSHPHAQRPSVPEQLPWWRWSSANTQCCAQNTGRLLGIQTVLPLLLLSQIPSALVTLHRMERMQPRNQSEASSGNARPVATLCCLLTNTSLNASSAPDKVPPKSSPSMGKQSRGFRITVKIFVISYQEHFQVCHHGYLSCTVIKNTCEEILKLKKDTLFNNIVKLANI